MRPSMTSSADGEAVRSSSHSSSTGRPAAQRAVAVGQDRVLIDRAGQVAVGLELDRGLLPPAEPVAAEPVELADGRRPGTSVASGPRIGAASRYRSASKAARASCRRASRRGARRPAGGPLAARRRRRRAVAAAGAWPRRPLPTPAPSPSTPPRGPSPRRSRAGPRAGRAPRTEACGATPRAAARRAGSGPGSGRPDHADRRPAGDAGPTARTGRRRTVLDRRRRRATGRAGERHRGPRSCPGRRRRTPRATRAPGAPLEPRTGRAVGACAGAITSGTRPRSASTGAVRTRAISPTGVATVPPRTGAAVRRRVAPSLRARAGSPPGRRARDVRPAEPDRAPAEDPDRVVRPSWRDACRTGARRTVMSRTWARPTAARPSLVSWAWARPTAVRRSLPTLVLGPPDPDAPGPASCPGPARPRRAGARPTRAPRPRASARAARAASAAAGGLGPPSAPDRAGPEPPPWRDDRGGARSGTAARYRRGPPTTARREPTTGSARPARGVPGRSSPLDGRREVHAARCRRRAAGQFGRHPTGRRCSDDRGNAKERPPRRGRSSREIRRRPTLPGGLPPSTIGAGGLNCRVRDGNGCDPAAMATGNLLSIGRQPTIGGSPMRTPERARALVHPSPRPISTGRLNTLPCVHLRPINVVV